MRVIYKYELPMIDAESEVRLPMRPGKVLLFGNQSGRPMIWALVDSDAAEIERRFLLLMTGQEYALRDSDVPRGGPYDAYIGTAYFGALGAIVVHCFERRPAPPRSAPQ